jgi:hypothetical protein
VITVVDQPNAPLRLETFINVRDETQRQEFACLSEQDELLLLFYDESLEHRLTKRVRNHATGEMSRILNWADKVATSIPTDEYDFDRAKVAVQASTSM